jgi:hypothetical protein
MTIDEKTPTEPFPLDEPDTVVESDTEPPPAEPTLRDVMAELVTMRRAMVTTADEVTRLRARVFEIADDHGTRLGALERAPQAAANHAKNGADAE